MKGKYKMTGCARFFIFLLILLPIAWFGSKYLRESGMWDNFKDKVENRDDNSVERAIEEKSDRFDIPAATESNNDQFKRLREDYEEQELLLAQREQTIKNLQQENDALRRRLNEPVTNRTPTNNPPPRNQPTNNTGSPSLEDLLQEADSNLGTSSDNSDSGNSSASRNVLGTWDFNYSGSSGTIEFYQQNNRLLSRISASGVSSTNIDELIRSNNRFDVKNSPTGEYYILLGNGNLEAYDRNGYQTTCRRK